MKRLLPLRRVFSPLAGSGQHQPTRSVSVWRRLYLEALEDRTLLSIFPIGSEFRVNNLTPGDQSLPSVAMDPAGDSITVWADQSQPGAPFTIRGHCYPNGDAQGKEFQVNASEATGYSPTVAMDAKGDFVVAWNRADFQVVARRFDSQGNATSDEFVVNQLVSSSPAQPAPKVAMNAVGAFVIAWTINAPSGYSYLDVKARAYNASGQPLGPEFDPMLNNQGIQQDPAVAIDSSGNFVVAWTDYEGADSGHIVKARLFSPNTSPQNSGFTVNSSSYGSHERPAVAFDQAGKFMIVWVGNGTTGDYGIFAQRFTTLGNFEGAEYRLINTNILGPICLARAGEADSLVSWADTTGQGEEGAGVYGLELDPQGNPFGSLFHVNTTKTGDQYAPALAMSPGGDYLAVWSGNGESDDKGVYAQKYAYQPLTAIEDTYTTDEGTPVRCNILRNDINPEGSTLSAIQLTNPAHGSVVYLATDGIFRYTPMSGITNGTDTFTYVAYNGFRYSDPTAVTITVIKRPVLTIITEGWNATEDISWTYGMAEAINNQLTPPYQAFPSVTPENPEVPTLLKRSVVKPDEQSFRDDGDPNVMIFDWRSFQISSVAREAGAEYLYSWVEDRLDSAPAPIDIHFIGHSRGTVVNSEAIKMLVDSPLRNKIATLHQTMLDPHPAADPLYFDPRPVAPTVPNWWTDDYYQRDPDLLRTVFLGMPINGALNIDITDNVSPWHAKSFFEGGSHNEVHDWYQWTIDTKSSSSIPYAGTTPVTEILRNSPLYYNSNNLDLDRNGVSDNWNNGSQIGYCWTVGQLGSTARPKIPTVIIGLRLPGAVIPGPRKTPVGSLQLAFSNLIDPLTLQSRNFRITVNGIIQDPDKTVAVGSIPDASATILFFDPSMNGDWTITAAQTGIRDAGDSSVTGSAQIAWLLDTVSPFSKVQPLSSTETNPAFDVLVAGNDPVPSPGVHGSGIAAYDLYVSVDGAAFSSSPWATVPFANPVTTFHGSANHSYAFYSIAVDNAGNRESKSPLPEATTRTLLDNLTNKYVDVVYRDVLVRAPDPSSLDVWTKKLDLGLSRATFSNAIDHSEEYYGTIIKPAYLQFLGRNADQTGLAYWIQRMSGGLTDERLEAGFIGSPEYYNHSGNTDRAWIGAMYRDLLGRNPDKQGEDYWVAQLSSGADRSAVAFGFAGSSEREGQHVQANYLKYLGRHAGSSEIDYWINQFVQHGKTNEDIITGFVSSDEYYENHTR